MTPTECLEQVAKAEKALTAAINREALYAVTFGGADPLTVAAHDEVSRCNRAIRTWSDMAVMHPKTRAAALRNKTLPAEVFGF